MLSFAPARVEFRTVVVNFHAFTLSPGRYCCEKCVATLWSGKEREGREEHGVRMRGARVKGVVTEKLRSEKGKYVSQVERTNRIN